jgi:hypothetical protein
MLCRWEHGDFPPGPEYAQMLARLYQVRPRQLGLDADRVFVPQQRAWRGYVRVSNATTGSGYQMAADDSATALAAVRE